MRLTLTDDEVGALVVALNYLTDEDDEWGFIDDATRRELQRVHQKVNLTPAHVRWAVRREA